MSVRLKTVMDEVPALIVVLAGPELVIVFANQRHRQLIQGEPEVLGHALGDVLEKVGDDPLMRQYEAELRGVMRTGRPVQAFEAPVRLPGIDGETFWDYVVIPLREKPGQPPSGVVLYATDVTRLVKARARATEAERRFTALFDSNVTGVWITDDTHVLEANEAFLTMIGRTRADIERGLDWAAITAPTSIEADQRAMRALQAHGVAPPYEKEYVRPDGTRVPVLVSGARLQSDPMLVLATCFDLTERRATEREVGALLHRERDARFAAELAGARMTRLQEITASLSASNSADEIGRAVVNHAVEELSASAGILLRATPEAPADLRLAYAVGVAPERAEQWRAYPATLPEPLLEAARFGFPTLLAGADVVAGKADDLAPAGAVVAFPLEVSDRTLGVLGLVFRQPRELPAQDRRFLLSLSGQAAAALDRAQLYENRAYVARKLQEGLLPRRLATIDGLEAAAIYESISGGGEVGGDFYDLFEAAGEPPGCWALVVGDVCGKGTEAAVVTGLARHTLRAVARMVDDTAGILAFLNDELRRHANPPAFCTVGCALIAPAEGGGFDVRVSSGGHPFPLLLRADGTLEEVEVHGTMLGVADDPQLDQVDLHLAAGDALVVYTDGVVDARQAGGERFGERRLMDALRAASGGSAQDLAAAVDAAVRAHHPTSSADDRAIVVIRAAR